MTGPTGTQIKYGNVILLCTDNRFQHIGNIGRHGLHRLLIDMLYESRFLIKQGILGGIESRKQFGIALTGTIQDKGIAVGFPLLGNGRSDFSHIR